MSDKDKLLSGALDSFNTEALEQAIHPRVSNVRPPPRLQRILDNAVNELMQWSAETFLGLPQPPELTVVGFRLQANTVLFTMQRKYPADAN
jgi:hypothetical protein